MTYNFLEVIKLQFSPVMFLRLFTYVSEYVIIKFGKRNLIFSNLGDNILEKCTIFCSKRKNAFTVNKKRFVGKYVYRLNKKE